MKTISSRFLKASLAMFLVVVMLFGSTITGFAASVDNADTKANVDAAQTGATLTSDGTAILFMDLSNPSWWLSGSGNNNFCYFFNSSTNKWSAHAVHYSGNDYYVVVPAGSWTTVILTRNNTTTSPSWDNKWNQTGNITLSNTNNCLYGFSEGSTNASWSSIKPTSTVSLSASSTSVNVNTNVTLTPSLTSNQTFNTIKSTSYSISPSTGASISGNTFTATKAGTYTVTASITYNAKGYTNLTTTATATKTITVKDPGFSYTAVANPTAGGSVSPTSGTASSVSLTATPKTGYHFVNWTATNGSFSNANSATTTFTPSANNAVATANFALNVYEVKFVDGFDNSVIETQNVTHGDMPTEPTPPTHDRYEFVGWDTPIVEATGAVTYTALYAKNVFEAKFNDYDNTQIGDTQLVNKGETPVVPADPERLGYDFIGWTPEVGPMENDVTFTATYEIIDYTITLDSDGGTECDPIPYTVEANTITLPQPSKTGYNFITWVDADGNEYLEIPKGSTGNLDLTAVYEIKTYTVTVSKSIAEGGIVTINGTEATSVTVEHGQEVSIEATANDGYAFRGFQRVGYSNVDYNNPLVITPDKDAEYVVNFVKVWSVDVNVPTESMKSVALNENQGISTSVTKTYTVNDGTQCNVTGKAKDGYRLIGFSITQNGVKTDYYSESVAVTINTDTIVEPIVEKLYYAVVNGNLPAADDYYVAGEEVTLSFAVPTGKYLASVSIEPAMDLEVNIDKLAGTVTFEMPQADVNFVPNYADSYTVSFSADVFTSIEKKDYYYPGESVSIKVTPKGGHLITNITSEQTDVTYDKTNKVITFTMPAENVTLDVEYQASFKAYSEVITVHIDNPSHSYDSTVAGGTVTMTCNGTTLAQGGFADGDITYTATPKSDYSFVGFYSDYYCNKLLSTEATYTVSPEGDTTVYALFARKQYIRVSGQSFKEMAFDPNTKAYTMVYTLDGTEAVGTATISQALFDSGFDFDVHYNKSASNHAYYGYDSTFTTDMNKNSSNRTVSWGSDRWHVSGSSANTNFPLTITVKPYTVHTYNSIDVSAKASKSGMDVFLSSGRYKVGDATTTITTEGISATHVTPTGHNDDNEEYKKMHLTEATTLSWELTIGGDNYSGFTSAMAAGTYVDSFVVYDIVDKTFEIVEPVSLGSNKYQGTVVVDSDCYIVPVFFHTEDYCEANSLVSIDLYFDASAIQNLNWGPFVAAYAWGANDSEYFGEWPGQMLIPTEDGKSFYTQLDVPAAGSANAAEGITFNNYLFASCPTNEQGIFGLGSQNVQTYDYREAITLYEAGYEAITFVAKVSEDGYHGDTNDGSNIPNTVSTSTTGIKDKYSFDYLYCRDGVTPMDFTGNAVTETEGATVDDITNADYYVVAKGDVIYSAGGYSGDSKFNGDWCVDWYIFDSNGKYITKVLSTALWHDLDTTDDIHQTVLMTALGLTPETAAGKTVAISYEAPNNCPKDNGHDDSHQLAYDGQWYGNMLDHTVTGQVIVGLDDGDGNFTIETDEELNKADYGEAFLKDQDGNTYQTLDITIEYGKADLTASAKGNYRFVGWYTKKADGTYSLLNTSANCSPYINMNETYYAIFRELGDTEVSITHAKYVNTDPAIPSHDGVGELSIEVRDSDGDIVAEGPIKTNSTQAVFSAHEGETYTVKIITTPLMKGKFFAWYTDSTKADGTKTYEEVFTEPEHIGSESTVYAEFEYTYDSEDEGLQKNITIYSDIRRVSNEAKIYYQYTNRFGQQRVYSTKVTLSDKECLGYEGNDYMKYCPTWMTLCTFEKNGVEETLYVKPSEVKSYTDNGYTLVESYNYIEALAPTEDVTEVFNGTVKWDVTVNLTPAESEVRLTASQGAPTYNIVFKIGDGSESRPGTYNTLVEYDAPQYLNGEKFSYWYDETTGEIAAYTSYYNYRIVENKVLRAVYGAEISQDWTPSINSVTYTREFGDNADTIYTDYLLAYNNKDGKILNEWKTTDNIQYGLLVVRDSAYYIEDSSNVTYPDSTNEAIKEKLELVAKRGSSAAFTVDSIKYNCYCYDLTDKTLTNFNRCDYYRMYDNKAVVGGSHYYREYAFTAVAYIIVNGEVFLSNPREVNFFDLGNEVPTTNPVL